MGPDSASLICPNCRHENPSGAKFCNHCGTALPLLCANCGHENPAGSRFCNNCGHKLGAELQPAPQPPAPQPPPQLRPSFSPAGMQELMPEEYAARLESARASHAMVGERRVVTMLFGDIKGSTAAAGQLDPEEWAAIINPAFEHMIAPVYKYEGTVARLMGDGILAFFGAPVAHEDDPQRAILAALEIVAGIQPYRDQVAREWGVDIDVRVGINTGLVMVGHVGSDLQMEYTALGDAINLAARMEQTAAPGTVQVSAETFRRVAPLFEFEELGQVAVKGKAEPVLTYRPVRRRRQPRRVRGSAGLDSPLVGRARELDALRAAVAGLEQGLGGIVCLLGEAGLGKSRLIQETAAFLAAAGPALGWHETASNSYEAGQPYALFQRLLRRLWELAPGDSAAHMQKKVRQLLPAHVAEAELFGVLLGAAAGQTGVPEGEAFKRELYRAMAALWERECARRPTVLVFDDLHWSDPASVELLAHLFQVTDRAPLLLLCALRPDRETPGWAIKQAAEEGYPHRYREISLQPLGAAEAGALVEQLFAGAGLPLSLRQRILDKTDGNPLFVEEVLRSLIDRGMLVAGSDASQPRWQLTADVEDVDIPRNLQALLIARIDRLEEAARHTLQLASVIGRSFHYRVLEAIDQAGASSPADLDHELIILQRKELIRLAARQPEPEYLFQHVLTQEATYSTILLRERRVYHRRVGEAIEQLFADRLEEFFPVLAHHFGRAHDPRAVRYGALAGDAAFRIFALAEALSHYTAALELARRELARPGSESAEVVGSISPPELTRLFLRRGRCLELQSEHADALENYAAMEALARERDDRPMLLAALLAAAVLYAIPNPVQDSQAGQRKADEGLALARELADQEAEARLLWVFMLLQNYAGFMAAGIPFGEQAVAMARRLEMQELLAYALQDMSLALTAVGRLDEADAALAESRPLWKAQHMLPMLAENHANTTYVRVAQARFDEGLYHVAESTRIAESANNAWGVINARVFAGLMHATLGEVDSALELAQALIAGAEKYGHPADTLGWFALGWLYTHLGAHGRARETSGRGFASSADFPPFHPLSVAMAARQRLHLGDVDGAAALLAEAGHSAHRNTLQLIDVFCDLVTAELYLAQGDAGRAQAHLEELLGRLRATGARFFLPNALQLISRTQLEQGREAPAHEALMAARDAAAANGARLVLWPLLAGLGERAAAQEIVDFIAGHTSELELRQTFLDHARAVMDAAPG